MYEDILNQWFKNTGQNGATGGGTAPFIDNYRQQMTNQFLNSQQPPQQQQQQQNPMSAGNYPLRQALYMQNLQNQGSTGFGSSYSPLSNPNSMTPTQPVPTASQQQAPVPTQQSAADNLRYISPSDMSPFLANANKGDKISLDNWRDYYLGTSQKDFGAFDPYNTRPASWKFVPEGRYYINE